MADVFRKVYSPITNEVGEKINAIKDKAQELYDLLIDAQAVTTSDGRSIAVAKTELETAVMWAIKGLTA